MICSCRKRCRFGGIAVKCCFSIRYNRCLHSLHWHFQILSFLLFTSHIHTLLILIKCLFLAEHTVHVHLLLCFRLCPALFQPNLCLCGACSLCWSCSRSLCLDPNILVYILHLQRLECLALACSVWHVEAQINPQDRVEKNDQNLNGKGDGIKRSLREIIRHR